MDLKNILKRASPRRRKSAGLPGPLFAAIASFALAGIVALSPRAGAEVFWETHGFEDDVDLVTAPNREFIVIPEESEDGSMAQVTIINVDPDTGAPLGPTAIRPVLGFENAVDIMITECAPDEPPMVVVPMESEDGSAAGILLLEVDADTGAVLREESIDLGDLGFRPDVDGTWTVYPFSPVTPLAMYALESELGDVKGVIAIDINNAAGDDFGDCLLISTDGRAGCTAPALIADWLPGLADGVDPLSYPNLTVPAARMVLPIASADENDILLIDFDPNDAFGSPIYIGHVSVKETNAGSANPTPFPGFERDVDMALITDTCGLIGNQLLVPVEGPDDDADLYLLNLDADGDAEWTYSVDGDPLIPILGYEAGVDMVVMCGLPAAPFNRVAVPIENAAGTDADFLIVNLETGALFAHAEDPALNPGLVIPGYEIGIDPLRWTGGALVVPAEGPDGLAKLYTFTPAADLVAFVFSDFYGYVRSVDPIALSVTGGPPALFTPVMSLDGTDADIWMSAGPPVPATTTLEAENPGLTINAFEWDVDLGTVFGNHAVPHYMYLPEEDPDDGTGRVRFQEIPSIPEERKLVVATNELGALPATLYFFGSGGDLELLLDTVWGLETGLDMADAGGPIRFSNPPGTLIPGQDADTDPTLAWLTETAGVPGQPVNQAAQWRVYHANPFVPHGSVSFTLPAAGEIEVEVFDAAGRKVCQLFKGRKDQGEHSISWDARNAAGKPVAAGVYFLRIRGQVGVAVSKFAIVR